MKLFSLEQKNKPTYCNKDQHFLFTIRDYLLDNNVPYDPAAFTALREREAGKKFTLREHIKALVYSQMSAQTQWSRIVPHLNQVDKLFRDYDPEFIKSMSGEYFAEKIFDIHCGSRCTKSQMKVLAENVAMLEHLDKKFGGIDRFVTSAPADVIVKKLSDTSSPYKLKWVGKALAYEYLRNVGIDCAKPDVHLCRFFGADRMGNGVNSPASEEEVLKQIDKLSKESGLLRYEIDILLWEFCASGMGEVCNANPKCNKCPISSKCRKGRML